jgi:hypothetical protein
LEMRLSRGEGSSARRAAESTAVGADDAKLPMSF